MAVAYGLRCTHKCCGALKKRQQLLQNNENERYETDIGTSMVLNTTGQIGVECGVESPQSLRNELVPRAWARN